MMKITSYKLLPKKLRMVPGLFFLKTPYLSSRKKNLPSAPAPLVTWTKLFLSLSGLLLIIIICRYFFSPLQWQELVIISPVIFFLTEGLGALGQILFYRSPVAIQNIHQEPLKAVSLGDFWGRRWNIWVQDWLRDISQGHIRKIHNKLFISFLVSGVFHEFLGNLPWLLYYQECYFGNMMLYFAIQGMGLWVERTWLKGTRPWVKRMFLWTVVLLPSPLFLNKPILVFIGAIHE